jgi:hypothetical protein
VSLTDAQRAAYRFLLKQASTGTTFTAADLEKVAGWKPGSFSTYKTKHLRDYVSGKGRLTVSPRFQRVSESDFAEIVGQSRTSVARFQHVVVHAAVRYEFLLPLTNERRLREALDELFYREPLEQRAREIGREELSRIIPARDDEADDAFFSRVVDRVGPLLGGYSIAHVDGRFRASPLLTYEEAARVLAERRRYLVDETTAVVRFIIPIAESRAVHGSTFDLGAAAPKTGEELTTHIDVARRLFIAFFVESVILGIHSEDEIWFLESGPAGERLYVLERDPNRGARSVSGVKKLRSESADQLDLPSLGDSLDGWLRQNGYRDVADKRERVLSIWRQNGVKTRRNWWDVLAGDQSGQPREVAGEKFPVIALIRKRQGLAPVRGALWKAGEVPPPARERDDD